MPRATGVPAYTLQQLAAFVAVADTGTIAAAAGRMQLSPSAVRSSLGDLERALGAQLTVRQRAKGVELTAAGQVVLAKARIVLHESLDLEADVRGEPGQVTGILHVGCYATLGPTALPPLLQGYTRHFPAVRVELREDTLDGLRAAVDAGDVDVALTYDVDLPRHWKRVVCQRLHPRVHIAADHPLAAGGSIRLADLADEPMVLLDVPPSREHVLDMCRGAGIEPRIALRTSNFETARALVGRGLGWALLVQRTPSEVSYEGRPIVSLEVVDPALPSVEVVVTWPRDARLSRAAQAFAQLAAKAGRRAQEAETAATAAQGD
ncbi:MAG TPA: LysR substrate-binding domain-containing protein [Dermatophilaceae bacterium]|nr:LysR substrate-binding domain-containing protein [Dermatophilaceae bacterium]